MYQSKTKTRKYGSVQHAIRRPGISRFYTRKYESCISRSVNLKVSFAQDAEKKLMPTTRFITRLDAVDMQTRGRVKWISPYSSMFVSSLPCVGHATSGLKLIRRKSSRVDGRFLEQASSEARYRKLMNGKSYYSVFRREQRDRTSEELGWISSNPDGSITVKENSPLYDHLLHHPKNASRPIVQKLPEDWPFKNCLISTSEVSSQQWQIWKMPDTTRRRCREFTGMCQTPISLEFSSHKPKYRFYEDNFIAYIKGIKIDALGPLKFDIDLEPPSDAELREAFWMLYREQHQVTDPFDEMIDFSTYPKSCPYCGDADGPGQCTEQANCLNISYAEEMAAKQKGHIPKIDIDYVLINPLDLFETETGIPIHGRGLMAQIREHSTVEYVKPTREEMRARLEEIGNCQFLIDNLCPPIIESTVRGFLGYKNQSICKKKTKR